MTRIFAEALVRGWIANDVYGSVAQPDYPYWNHKSPIRRMLAYTNKLASNALWDGHPNEAMRLLLVHGLKDQITAREKILSNTKKQYRAHRASYAAWLDFKEKSPSQNIQPRRIKR